MIDYITKPEVKLLSYTNNPEKVVATAARTCYSIDDPITLYGKLSDEDVKKAISYLPASHTSPFEHASFTFAINSVSRTLLAQITRHRIATFSVKSQRYVNTIKDFRPYIPESILNNPEAKEIYDIVIDKIAVAYEDIQTTLVVQLAHDMLINEFDPVYETDLAKAYRAIHHLSNKDEFIIDKDAISEIFTYLINLSVADRNEWLKKYDLDYLWLRFVDFRRRCGEDARYILPNACNTSMVMTMNAGSLMHFFNLRCCNRAQEEIRYLAWRMRDEVMKVAPAIFDGRSGPSCLVTGKCSEGIMTCKKPYTKDNIPHYD